MRFKKLCQVTKIIVLKYKIVFTGEKVIDSKKKKFK